MKDINIQVLETEYVINLGQLLRITLDTKRYIFKPVKYVQLVQPKLVQPKLTSVTMVIDCQMVVIQIQVGKNFIDDVLIDRSVGINIITENLRV